MRRPTFIAIGLALAGCGDPLVGDTFTGTPVFSIGGAVVQANPRVPASHGVVSARLFWIGATDAGGEQAARLDADLAEFSMTLFEPPPAEATAFGALVEQGTLGLAVIGVYADTDDDQRYDPEVDRLLGASAQHVVVHTSEGVAAGSPAAALLGELPPGYHLYEHDQPSACRFVQAASCPEEGGLRPAESPQDVTLTLWAAPEDVRVPAPALEAGASIWTTP